MLVGHKFSDEFPIQSRLSWSTCELHLLIDLPQSIKQVYTAVKYIFKGSMKKLCSTTETGGGRSQIGSYHLKTVFLWNLEKRPPTMKRSQFELMVDILNDLNQYLAAGKLSHYFLPDCNLLETVRPDEQRFARHQCNRPISQIRAPSGGLSRTSGKLWQDYSNCYMFWT